jgi:hypothetical protein
MTKPSISDFRFSSVVSAMLLISSVPLAAGCGSEASRGADERADQGEVSLPLVTTTNGSVYRLNVFLALCGMECTFLSSSDDPNETAITALLNTGTYNASLQFWSLEKRADDGSFLPVQATLLSSPFSSFQIFNGTTTTLSYQFKTDGITVTVGRGSVKVVADVTETPPVCTAFGSECAEGSWCPPSELTGAFPACIAAGNLAIGAPCGDPASCGANASCFDVGTGAVCLALCAAAEFDQPCPSGGTCEPAGTTYGICR